MVKPTITVIGLGNAGTAFLKIFTTHGYKVVSALSRKIDPSFKKEYPKTTFSEGVPEFEDLGDIVFLTVPDDAIEALAEQLARKSTALKDKNFVHCSGALSSEVLLPLKSKGALTASFHPIASITPKTETFQDIWFDMEGDSSLLDLINSIAEDLGAQTLKINAEHKVLLHAAAVSASNYLVVLANLTAGIASNAGISEEQTIQAFLPLMKTSITNIEQLGIAKALTGPIARGDVQTISMHLQQLEKFPEIASLYKTLGRGAVELARQGSVDPESLKQIKKILN